MIQKYTCPRCGCTESKTYENEVFCSKCSKFIKYIDKEAEKKARRLAAEAFSRMI